MLVLAWCRSIVVKSQEPFFVDFKRVSVSTLLGLSLVGCWVVGGWPRAHILYVTFIFSRHAFKVLCALYSFSRFKLVLQILRQILPWTSFSCEL